jgi:enoyl-CoA hydratase
MVNIMDGIIKATREESGILQICLNRPDQLNALSMELLQQLLQLLREVKQDNSVKAILLTGAGKAFCAGADIHALAALDASTGLAFARFGQAVFNELELLGKPSLAAISGYALGGGCELAMAATLRIAAKQTVFGQPEIKLGVIPGFGGTQRLSRLIGKGRALDICLTGRRFTADEAYQWGLVTEVTSQEDLLDRAKSLLKELVKLSPVAIRSVITTIHQGYNLPLDQALELEAAHFGLCCASDEKQVGVQAFLEKRKA